MMVSIFRPRRPGSRQSVKRPSWFPKTMMIFFRMFRVRYGQTIDLLENSGLALQIDFWLCKRYDANNQDKEIHLHLWYLAKHSS